MHCLHSQYLVVTLFIVEHRAREVVEYILCRQWAIRLESSVGQGQATKNSVLLTCIHSCQMKNRWE
jgi:hypothetical protein